MKKKLGAIAAGALAVCLAFAMAGCGSSSSSSSSSAATVDNDLQFVTGGETGTYYAFGTVLANWCTNNTDTQITALTGNGSQANIQALQDGDADVAFCQSDVLAYAYEGTNLFEKDGAYTDFSIVAALYQEQVQIVTIDPTIKSVSDLKGKKVGVGATGSGVYFNAVDVLNAYGIDIDSDIDAQYLDFKDSSTQLQDGKIDAAFVVAGAPTTSITDLAASKSVYLVSMDDEHVNKLLESSPYYSKATIPASAYGLESDVTTVGVQAVIIANNNVSEDAIYNLVSSIYDGAEKNASAHAKYSELSLETGASVTTVPYHAGAAKFFKENNLTVK